MIGALCRHRRRSDDRGSLAVAMLVSMVGAMLATMLLPVLLVQVRSTQQVSDRVRSLHAAQAGLDTALTGIRSATDADGAGALELLPCGPIDGSVAGGPERFEVSIYYLATDPKGMSDSWLTANQIRCVQGGGAFAAPAFAMLRARGTTVATGTVSSAPGREVRGTYVFRTTVQQIRGGAIRARLADTSISDLCLDAGSSAPSAGAAVRLQTCEPGKAQQTWAYEKNLNLRLVASKTSTPPLGLCIDAGPDQNDGDAVLLQPCAAVTQTQQQWGFNNNFRYTGSVDIKACLGLPGGVVAAGAFFAITRCKGTGSTSTPFQPDVKVGAGAAGESSGQLVNFKQFGRCLDVPGFDAWRGFLIAFQCKQAVDPSTIGWNQRVTIPADDTPGPMTLTKDSAPFEHYCVTSPAAVGAGAYPSIVECPATLAATMKWTVLRNTGTYATSYEITDLKDHCLAPDPTDFYVGDVSRLTMQVCDGSTLQKWNAPPSLGEPAYKDISER